MNIHPVCIVGLMVFILVAPAEPQLITGSIAHIISCWVAVAGLTLMALGLAINQTLIEAQLESN